MIVIESQRFNVADANRVRRLLAGVFGRRYDAECERYRALLRERIRTSGGDCFLAALALAKILVENRTDHCGTQRAWLMAAALDVSEESPPAGTMPLA